LRYEGVPPRFVRYSNEVALTDGGRLAEGRLRKDHTMQRFGSTLAFASGSVASTVIALTAMSLHGQSSPRDNAFHVCVGKDRVLRLVETDEPCPQGQERLRLQEADVPDVEPPKDADAKDDAKTQQPAEDQKSKKPQTDAPEQAEFKKVPRQPAVSKVKAPFEVVDASGRTIIRVDSSFGGTYRGIGVYDAALQGEPVAYMLASPRGNGVLRAESPSGEIVAVITATEERAAAQFGAEGQGTSATIGTTPNGRGMVEVGNGTTSLAAMVAGPDDKGQIEVNSGDTNVVTLREGHSGGLLQIADNAGRTMVEAGVDRGGFGVVRAGPTSGPAYMVGSGIFVSRIVGETKGK